MSGAGNDFIIFDFRPTTFSSTNFDKDQIRWASDRRNIGCDQFIIIRAGIEDCDAVMEIYNSDGSLSAACGNATRCVASIILADTPKQKIKIKTLAGILECSMEDGLISVDMGIPKFLGSANLYGMNFLLADIGNPHAITFLDATISDNDFFKIGPLVELDKIFPHKTNVEFARIINDGLIEVRVWERGAGETLACGSGACCVAFVASKTSLIKSNQVTVRFSGGDLIIKVEEDDLVIMKGDHKRIFDGLVYLSDRLL